MNFRDIKEEYREFFCHIDVSNPDYSACVTYPKGWETLIDMLFIELKIASTVKVNDKNVVILRIEQVKEKFGELRVYYSITNEEANLTESDLASISSVIEHLVDKYTIASRSYCVTCGNQAIMRQLGWISPYCDAHYNALKAQKDGLSKDTP